MKYNYRIINIFQKLCFVVICLTTGLFNSFADEYDLNTALQNAYKSCVGIDDAMYDLKVMAGINTAVTAVGTATGTGALVVGIVKASKDKDVTVKLDKLREIEKKHQNWKQMQEEGKWEEFKESLTNITQETKTEIEKYEKEKADIKNLKSQSKKLGNWRTGLLAGSTATNVAGSIIAGTNKVKGDLKEQINNCKSSIKHLRESIMQARINGEDVTEANDIVNVCGEFEYIDISSINTRGKGALISSVVGATAGIAGTVTSAMANTEKIRNDDTKSGQQKEEGLNTASNVLAGATTVASGVATVFNATQISAIKKVASVASKCTGVLK